MSQPDHKTQPPFGQFALSPWRDRLRKTAGQIRKDHKRVSSILRRLSLFGQSPPYDVEPLEGFRIRVFPRENHTDKLAFLGLDIQDSPDALVIERAAAITQGDQFRVVDLGANSGIYSIMANRAATRVNKTAQILCVEANPVMADRLEFNLASSGVDNVKVERSAVSDKAGTVNFDRTNKNLGQARVVTVDQAGESISVPCHPLKDMLENAGFSEIDFMKVDIEGHEVVALAPFFATAKPALFPKQVLIEVEHDTDGDIEKLFTRHGYEKISANKQDAVFVLKGAVGNE